MKRNGELETRRSALRMLGGFSLAVVGCGAAATSGTGATSAEGGASGTGDGGATATDDASLPALDASNCAVTPDETAGPYPDKTGMLQNSTFYRQDVTEGKTGLPLSLTLLVVDTNNGCAPIANAAVEIWHCDKDGVYSEYGGQPGVSDQTGTTFLRGLQTTDANGQVRFTTIYPGWYQGRATHIHIEVFSPGGTTTIKTTQLAFPEEINAAVYGQATQYYTKGQNPTSNASDNVFAGGDTYELATLAGGVTSGYAASLVIGVAT